LHVAALDVIEASPSLNIKPRVAEFVPRSPVFKPVYISELV